MPRPFVILSLSGGGYCGLYTARIIERIQQDRGKDNPLVKSIDLVAGTSIGGIIALGIAHGCSPYEIRHMLERRGRYIFRDHRGHIKRNFRNALSFIRSLAYAKYDNRELKSAILSIIGENSFSETEIPSVIPSVCLNKGKPELFRNFGGAAQVFDSVQVGMATSAAPTYFSPYQINDDFYIDGGIIANNPDNIALLDSMSYFKINPEDIVIISIGALNANLNRVSKKSGFSGLLPNMFAARHAISFTLEAQQQLSGELCERLLGERYLRITSEPGDARKDLRLDAATKDVARTLKSLADDEYERVKKRPVMQYLLNGSSIRTVRWESGQILP